MTHARFFALAALALLASCATVPASSVSAPPSGPASIPSTPLDLGDWRNASENAVAQRFEGAVSGRYAAGHALSAVSADLRSAAFSCAGGNAGDRGDPPAQICRRSESQSGCTHTWQVLLYDANGDRRLARTRALYDRHCGDDGLLGGPG